MEEHVAPDGDETASDVAVGPGVAVLDDDVAGRVVAVGAAAAGEIVEEDVVLEDHVGHAVDVDVLVAAGLVVEDVVFDGDVPCPVVDLEDVVIEAVVQYVVAQHDAADVIGPAGRADEVLDLDDKGSGARPSVRHVEAFEGDPLAVEAPDDGARVPQARLVGHLRPHRDALREDPVEGHDAVVGPGRDEHEASVRDGVDRVRDRDPGVADGPVARRIAARRGDVVRRLSRNARGRAKEDRDEPKGALH